MTEYSKLRRDKLGELLGKEIFEVKPVILGGDPTDLANKTFLTREQHIQVVRYWNKIINKMRQVETGN